MKTIYKYPLGVHDSQGVMLPLGAIVLGVQFQGKQLCMWALVENDNSIKDEWNIEIVGTGQKIRFPLKHEYAAGISGGYIYFGTVQEPVRPLVWHIFGRMVERHP